MAEKKRKYGQITKGMQLTIVIEEAINDVLVVILEHGSKVFRGVLLDTKKRGLPPGICSAFGGNGDMKGNADDVSNETTDTEVDISAAAYRHTYNTNLAQFGTQFQGPPERNFRRLGASKSSRNIRLRPRQTLCSKCKSTCLDSDKGPLPVNSLNRTNNKINQLTTRQQTILPHTKLASSKSDPKKRHETRSNSQPKPTKLMKIEPTSKHTKTSPFIKISIGDCTVLNIPPRIHESDKEELSCEEKCTTETEDENVTSIEPHDFKIELQNNDEIGEVKEVIQKLRIKSRRSSLEDEKKKENVSNPHKRQKKSKHKPKNYDENDGDAPCSIIITENIDSEDNDDKSEVRPIDVVRPRLLYTWHQNKGLSPRHEAQTNNNHPLSPQHENCSSVPVNDKTSCNDTNSKNSGSRKEYKLRSRSMSLESNPEYEITQDSAYISYEDPKSVSDRSEGCSTTDTLSETDSSDYGDEPPGDENIEAFKPLLMKIHTNTVPKCITTDGRQIHIGDIVWAKIKGFPWWPARVLSISVSQRDNGVVLRQVAHIGWFGSATRSYIQCSDLYSFLDDFKLRFKHRKRGPYKIAIKQATIAAQGCSSSQSGVDMEEFDVS